MTVKCEKCNKPFRDNYDLKRHINKKTPCNQICDVSGVTINVTINNQQIINFNNPPNSDHITKRQIQRTIGTFDQLKPMYTTGKALEVYNRMLNVKPENRNAHIDPKSAIGMVWDGKMWNRILKGEIVQQRIKQSARSLSDRIDIVGVEAPETMVNCLEIMAQDALEPETSTLETEGLQPLTKSQNRDLVNRAVLTINK